MNKLFKVMLSSFLAFSMMFNSTVQAQEMTELTVEKIVANSRVGDGQREITSFEITVNDATLIEGITAEDFSIKNNGDSSPVDPATNQVRGEHAEDGIVLKVEGNTIIMEVTPFDIEGVYNASFQRQPWEVTCEKYPELSFKKNNITETKTTTLDDAIRGEFTYAGLTRKYALYMPENATGPVPLVVWNHGGGEYGSRQNIENTLVANKGLVAWPEAGHETAVLMIQVANSNFSYSPNDSKKQLIDQNNALQAALIKQLIAEGKVDENRVYVTGASSGGGATMRFVMQYPELFAGAIAMCSMDPIVPIHYTQDSYETIVEKLEAAFQGNVWDWSEEEQKMVSRAIDTEALINLPIYFTHAADDTTCKPMSSQAYYEALSNLGAKNNKITIWTTEEMAEYGIAPMIAHWSWVRVFNDTAADAPMAWLFQQEKPHLEVESIVANSRVGDGQREITSFEITVNDASFIEGLTAEDFDIVNNGNSSPVDPETNQVRPAYTNDGIKLTIEGNKIVMEVTPFDNEGVYNASFQRQPWKVVCEKFPELSFNKSNVTTTNTTTLDDAIRGEFTYAGLTRKYALYMPENATGPVPLVVWNHGGGEYGSRQNIENTLVANKGLVAWPEAGYETAVLMIQVANSNFSYSPNDSKKQLIDQNNALQAALIKQLIAEGKIDGNRVYVTGASSGGGATMRFVMQYPELFAGAIAMCSMDPIVPIHYTQDSYETIVEKLEAAFQGNVWDWSEEEQKMVSRAIDTEALINLPIYFTHAADDTTCKPMSSQAYYEALSNLGAKNNKITIWTTEEMAEYGIAPMIAHWSWVRVFNDTAADAPMAWLFQQEKPHLEILDIVANTRVGDGQREVVSFEITVNDSKFIEGISAGDISIKNNGDSSPVDPETNQVRGEYAEDGIKLTIEGNKITMEVTPFDIQGVYNASFQRQAWVVSSEKFPEFTFKASDIDEIKTETLDDFIRGEFTYAGLTRKYALYLPENATGPVPLVVWNHGGGEYGSRQDIENTLVANRGVTSWIENGYETAVLMIQVANSNFSYSPNDAKKQLIDQNNALQAALIKQLIAEGKVDADRVYVTGASSGGGATMRFVMQYPELFAGAIAMCSMDPIVPIHYTQDSYETIVEKLEAAFQGTVWTWSEEEQKMVEKQIDTEALINLPIHFTHAADDTTCKPMSSQAYYEALANLGAKNNEITIWTTEEMAEYGIAPMIAHWSWVRVFNDTSADAPMAWLFQQTNAEAPSTETGDHAMITPFVAMSMASLACLAVVVYKKRKEEQAN